MTLKLCSQVQIYRCFGKIVAFLFRVKTCALKMDVANPPKILANLYQITRIHILQDNILEPLSSLQCLT